MHDRHVIRLDKDVRQQIARHYQQQFGAPPDAARLAVLIQQYVRDEIFLREALALHLDQDDEIVRRRLVQKFEFLQAGNAPEQAPTDETLARWFAAHRGQYQTPATVAFMQRYFSPDQDGETSARRRALAVLRQLGAPAPASEQTAGDAFPGPASAGDLSLREAQRIFGECELTAQLFSAPIGAWRGPFRSGYGWHLVYISARQPAADAKLADIRPRVLADYLAEQRQAVADRAYEALRARYVIQDLP